MNPIFGIEDLSTLGLAILAAAAVCYGARTEAHVSIDFIHDLVPRRVTRWTDAAMNLGAAGISALACYALVTRACGIEKACITTNLAVEHAPFYYVLAISFALIALHFVLRLVRDLRAGDPADADGEAT